MAQPRDPFRSQRLIYRAIRIPGDEALFAAINNDRLGYMNSNSTNIKLPGAEDAETFQKAVAKDCLLGAAICLPSEDAPPVEDIQEASEGVPIGQINLKGASPGHAHHRSTELTIDILPAYQAKGYGGEAIRWALDYAFRRAGLHKVRIRAFEWNEGAVRLYEKLGFKHEGRERESLWHEGRFWDGIEMGMLDREWWEVQNSRSQN